MQQVVTELLHAAQQPAAGLACQQLVGENTFVPCLAVECTVPEGPTLESNDSVNADGLLTQCSTTDASPPPILSLCCDGGITGDVCSQPVPGLHHCAQESSSSTGGAHVPREQSLARVVCALHGCANLGYHDVLTGTHERCCTLAHERVLAAVDQRESIVCALDGSSSTGGAGSI